MLQKRSLTLDGHATSLALEPEFWAALEQIAQRRGSSLPAMLAELDRSRGAGALARSARLFVLANLQAEIAALRRGGGGSGSP